VSEFDLLLRGRMLRRLDAPRGLFYTSTKVCAGVKQSWDESKYDMSSVDVARTLHTLMWVGLTKSPGLLLCLLAVAYDEVGR